MYLGTFLTRLGVAYTKVIILHLVYGLAKLHPVIPSILVNFKQQGKSSENSVNCNMH